MMGGAFTEQTAGILNLNLMYKQEVGQFQPMRSQCRADLFHASSSVGLLVGLQETL